MFRRRRRAHRVGLAMGVVDTSRVGVAVAGEVVVGTVGNREEMIGIGLVVIAGGVIGEVVVGMAGTGTIGIGIGMAAEEVEEGGIGAGIKAVGDIKDRAIRGSNRIGL